MVPVGWLLSKEIFKTWQWVVALGPGDGGLAVNLRQKLAGGHRQRQRTRQPRGLHMALPLLWFGEKPTRSGTGGQEWSQAEVCRHCCVVGRPGCRCQTVLRLTVSSGSPVVRVRCLS